MTLMATDLTASIERSFISKKKFRKVKDGEYSEYVDLFLGPVVNRPSVSLNMVTAVLDQTEAIGLSN